jgi:1-acyl-sn-glycerol-3-phosphate acyltransferase
MSSGPLKTSLLQFIARVILRLFGWRTEVTLPETKKYVLIGAHHTSNWDFIIILLLMGAERLPIRWLGKDALFRGPMGLLMRALGGISVNRRERTNLVNQIASFFDGRDELIIGIAPEGTRSKVPYWKSGFYYIALEANVPVVMGYIDYAQKVCGLGPSFMPSGDIQGDFVQIREFYSGITGKFPLQQGFIGFVLPASAH